VVGPSRALNDDEPLYPNDPLMPHREDIYASPREGIFTDLSYNDEGVVTDFNNLETTMNVSPTPITRIHTIHPKTLGDPLSTVQTRSKVHKNYEAHAPKVGILIDLPFGKKAIGTKWVYRNKKDEWGVVVRDKARLVAQGHQQEEGIDYDEVFVHVARIEAIRIFLAFASYMGFIVYQMDMKSAFLYGTIDEEVYVIQPPGFVGLKFPNKKSWCDEFKELMKNSMKTASTPIETQKPLVKYEEAADVDVHLYRRLISWQCKKQTIVATSTIEVEYVAAAHCSTLVKGMLLEVTTAKHSKELASPKQTALGKDESNPLKLIVY
nr:copia protein [Tanacetum cinerariifolium]